jgi:site-specific DNA recombinase
MSTPPPSAPLRAALYARISADQEAKGLGVRRQLDDCRALAAKNGWVVVDEFTDNDISAFSGKSRPGYEDLQAAMKRQEIDVVVTWATDRLFRRLRQLEDWVDLIEATGIAIHSVQAGKIDLSEPYGRLVARSLTSVATLEVEMSTARVLRKHKQLAEDGAWIGKAVYGYTDKAEIIPEEAKIIQEMAERILAGEGLNEVARSLTNRGVPTARGSDWRAASIRNILRAPRIAGHRVHHGEISARDCWPAIVDEATHRLLMARFAPGRKAGAKPGGPRKYLLTGLLRCGKCGAGMVFCLNGKARTPSYRCARNAGSKSCGGMAVVSAPVEKIVAELAFLSMEHRTARSDNRLEEWETKRKEIERLREEAAEDFAAKILTRPAMHTIMRSLQSQELALGLPPRANDADAKTSEALRESWDETTTSRKREFLESVLQKVIVHPRASAKQAPIFDPQRLEPIWVG